MPSPVVAARVSGLAAAVVASAAMTHLPNHPPLPPGDSPPIVLGMEWRLSAAKRGLEKGREGPQGLGASADP